jgi:uncharacterized protein DUF4340
MRRLIVPVLVLIVVGAIWLAYSSYETNRISGRTVDNFLGLNPEEVDSITIITPIDTTILFLDNGIWYLADDIPRLAEAPAVANVLTKSSEIKVGDIHSENPERQDEYQVSDSSGILVGYYSNGELLNSVIIGKPAQDYRHSYVRLPGKNAVYKARDVLGFIFARQRNQWLDRTIFAFNPDSIVSMEFIYPDKGFIAELIDSTWFVKKLSSKEKLPSDTAKMRVALSLVSALRANDFVNATDSGMIDFGNTALTIKVRLMDSSEYSLEFSKVDEEAHRHYCRQPDLGDIYVIYTSVYGSLTRDISHFLR